MSRIKFFDKDGNIVLPYLGGEDGFEPFAGEYIYIPRPNFAYIYFTGTMPTDTSDTRTPTSLNFYMKVGQQVILTAKCELSIQGHGSTAYAKKGYTFDVLNADGDALSIKWGDMPAVDSFHLKAYATDMTHTRGISAAELWREMVGSLDWPKNLTNNHVLSLDPTQKQNTIFWADAKYSEDGFPCCVYLNGEFYGLYSLKLKKSRVNYAMDKSDKSCIFLDSASSGYSAYLSQAFDYTDWDLKNPKISGYEENGPITDNDVLTSIERLFSFTRNLNTIYAQHSDYIVLDHWLCWYILCELITHRDTSGNNYELCTWDNVHWSILPYDMDITLGLNAWSNYTIETSVTGFVVGTRPSSGDTTFWQNFRTRYATELSAMWTKLRKSGIISIGNVTKIYKGRASVIPPEVYSADKTKWGTIWTNGIPTIQQTIAVLQSRIAYLDSQWLSE